MLECGQHTEEFPTSTTLELNLLCIKNETESHLVSPHWAPGTPVREGRRFLPLVASETFMLANYKVVTVYTKSHMKIIKNANHVPGGKRRMREGQRRSAHLRS